MIINFDDRVPDNYWSIFKFDKKGFKIAAKPVFKYDSSERVILSYRSNISKNSEGKSTFILSNIKISTSL